MSQNTSQILNAIKLRHRQAASEWKLMTGEDGVHLTASINKQRNDLAILDRNIENADQEFIRNAHADITALIDMVDRAIIKLRSYNNNPPSALTEPSPEPPPNGAHSQAPPSVAGQSIATSDTASPRTDGVPDSERRASRQHSGAPSQADAQASNSREIKAKNQKKRPKNYTAECVILCNTPWFRKFLIERYGLDLPGYWDDKKKSDMVGIKVRGILKISTRRHLNTNKDAAQIWKHLRQEAWASRGFRGNERSS